MPNDHSSHPDAVTETAPPLDAEGTVKTAVGSTAGALGSGEVGVPLKPSDATRPASNEEAELITDVGAAAPSSAEDTAPMSVNDGAIAPATNDVAATGDGAARLVAESPTGDTDEDAGVPDADDDAVTENVRAQSQTEPTSVFADFDDELTVLRPSLLRSAPGDDGLDPRSEASDVDDLHLPGEVSEIGSLDRDSEVSDVYDLEEVEELTPTLSKMAAQELLTGGQRGRRRDPLEDSRGSITPPPPTPWVPRSETRQSVPPSYDVVAAFSDLGGSVAPAVEDNSIPFNDKLDAPPVFGEALSSRRTGAASIPPPPPSRRTSAGSLPPPARLSVPPPRPRLASVPPVSLTAWPPAPDVGSTSLPALGSVSTPVEAAPSRASQWQKRVAFVAAILAAGVGGYLINESDEATVVADNTDVVAVETAAEKTGSTHDEFAVAPETAPAVSVSQDAIDPSELPKADPPRRRVSRPVGLTPAGAVRDRVEEPTAEGTQTPAWLLDAVGEPTDGETTSSEPGAAANSVEGDDARTLDRADSEQGDSTETSADDSAPEGSLATLGINSIPASNVTLDGKALGLTPHVGVKLPPGSHVVVFEHPTHGKRSVEVALKPGQKRVVSTRF